jgi:hypothetical protein
MTSAPTRAALSTMPSRSIASRVAMIDAIREGVPAVGEPAGEHDIVECLGDWGRHHDAARPAHSREFTPFAKVTRSGTTS